MSGKGKIISLFLFIICFFTIFNFEIPIPITEESKITVCAGIILWCDKTIYLSLFPLLEIVDKIVIIKMDDCDYFLPSNPKLEIYNYNGPFMHEARNMYIHNCKSDLILKWDADFHIVHSFYLKRKIDTYKEILLENPNKNLLCFFSMINKVGENCYAYYGEETFQLTGFNSRYLVGGINSDCYFSTSNLYKHIYRIERNGTKFSPDAKIIQQQNVEISVIHDPLGFHLGTTKEKEFYFLNKIKKEYLKLSKYYDEGFDDYLKIWGNKEVKIQQPLNISCNLLNHFKKKDLEKTKRIFSYWDGWKKQIECPLQKRIKELNITIKMF